MKANKMIATALTLALGCFGLVACSSGGSAPAADQAAATTFNATYDITKDYMAEDPDTGALSLEEPPSTPMNEDGLSMATGYAAAFGSFVDNVSVDATLEVKDGTYTYTLASHCGSAECAVGNYSPVYTWTGPVTEQTDTSITVGAPTAATVTINAEGQFASNAETTGYFGENGYTANESTTDCPYTNIPAGPALLELFQPGTFTVSGGAIESFAAAA